MKRLVITHPEWGIYLGCAMGLGFWTKIDPVGQHAAVTFANQAEVDEHIASWDDFAPGVGTHPVGADDSGYASIAACVAAGLEGWLDEITPTEGPAQ